MKKLKSCSNFNVITLCLLIVSFLFIYQIPLIAEDTDMILVRLYEGARGENTDMKKVISSYEFESVKGTPANEKKPGYEEMDTLKRVFNLNDIRIHGGTLIVTPSVLKDTKKGEIHFEGKGWKISLTCISVPDNQFQVEVRDLMAGANLPSILTSKIIIPSGKTASLGFEGKNGKIFFLSFLRDSKLLSLMKKEKAPDGPRLIKRVEPVYPEELKKAGKSGRVVIEAATDEEGNVVKVTPIEGPKEFYDAAINALKQWKYEPFIIDGKKKSVKFNVVFSFKLDGEKKNKDALVISASKAPKLIVKVEPVYPEAAVKQKIQGTVVIEATIDVEGNVVNTTIIDGHPMLNQAAIDAIKQWKYAPFIEEGVKKSVKFTVVVRFKLNADKKSPKK